jgi:hypothetical protein
VCVCVCALARRWSLTVQLAKWLYTGWTSRIQFLADAGQFSSSQCPDRLWGRRTFCPMGTESSGKSSRSVRLETDYFHFLLTLRMGGCLRLIPLYTEGPSAESVSCGHLTSQNCTECVDRISSVVKCCDRRLRADSKSQHEMGHCFTVPKFQ